MISLRLCRQSLTGHAKEFQKASICRLSHGTTKALTGRDQGTKGNLHQQKCSSQLHDSKTITALFVRTYRARHEAIVLPILCSLHGESNWRNVNMDSLMQQPVRNAGHSHWHNVKHTKTAKDDEKRKVISVVTRKIRFAIKEHGGVSDPKLNSDLARAIEEGKRKNIPMSTMETFIKKTVQSKDGGGGQFILQARYGTGALVIECFTDNANRSRSSITNILKKHGAALGDSASMFDYKGVVYVPVSSEKPLTLDQAEELAIEVGAEDVQEDVDEDNSKVFQFICDPTDMYAVKKSLVSIGHEPGDVRGEYIPHTYVTMKDAQLEMTGMVLDALEANEDVVRVFHNIQSEEEAASSQ